MGDIADLVAKLDAWQRECAMLRVEPKGISTRELTELRAIVVAAQAWEKAYAGYMKDWPDGLQPDAADALDAAEDALVAAVRGEA